MPGHEDALAKLDRPFHLDDKGDPCARHPATMEGVLALAALGQRIPAFHHDVASKLQRLVFALDEIEELAGGDLREVAQSAGVVLRELQTVFAANRELGKPQDRIRTRLAGLVAKALATASVVPIEPPAIPPELEVEVTVAYFVHALAIACEMCVGVGYQGRSERSVSVTVEVRDTDLAIAIARPPGTTGDGRHATPEAVAIAAFELRRDGGELRCHGDAHLVLHVRRAM